MTFSVFPLTQRVGHSPRPSKKKLTIWVVGGIKLERRFVPIHSCELFLHVLTACLGFQVDVSDWTRTIRTDMDE